MSETVFGLGVVCILAGIVGGGIKALSIELPRIPSARTRAAVSAFGVLLSIGSAHASGWFDVRGSGNTSSIPITREMESSPGVQDRRTSPSPLADWGASDNCQRLRAIGEYDQAEAACKQGLDELRTATEPAKLHVRGSLLYGLGRIAECKGNVLAALSAYRDAMSERNRALHDSTITPQLAKKIAAAQDIVSVRAKDLEASRKPTCSTKALQH